METLAQRRNGAATLADKAGEHRQFIKRQRRELLRRLDRLDPRSVNGAATLDYVEGVLVRWHEQFDDCDLPAATGQEKAFWSALYQLEELAEGFGQAMHPYQQFMLDNLREVRELLRNGQPLPEHRYLATRPDGSFGSDIDDADML